MMENKHEESVQAIQNVLDGLIAKHGTHLIASVSLAIIDPQKDQPETVQIIQYGIKNIILLLLKDTLEMTEDEGEFIANEGLARTIN